MNLPQRWMSLPWNGRDVQKIGKKFDAIISSYDANGRAYHNLRHIEECLEEFDGARRFIQNPFAFELALWYHDLVYDTNPRWAGWNEEASAGVAFDHLSDLGLPSDFACRVATLILATKHEKAATDRDEQYIADIDLSILGKSKRRVDEYEAAIREEYSWVKDDAAFKSARAKILKGFLLRPQVFSTPFFREKYEASARQSLERLIQKNS